MIFPLVWRLLPGPLVVRLLLLAALLTAAVALCFDVVFPWLADDVLPAPDDAVGDASDDVVGDSPDGTTRGH